LRSPRPPGRGSRPDADGQVLEAHSASAGLDYPGVGPQIAALAAAGRLEVQAATDGEAFEAMRWLSRTEGILPALESAHALAVVPRLLAGVGASPEASRWPDEAVVLVGLSGRGDKDLGSFGRWLEQNGT
jgi:tryptophan synthase beta chain